MRPLAILTGFTVLFLSLGQGMVERNSTMPVIIADLPPMMPMELPMYSDMEKLSPEQRLAERQREEMIGDLEDFLSDAMRNRDAGWRDMTDRRISSEEAPMQKRIGGRMSAYFQPVNTLGKDRTC
jgi:hypothetical protein